MDINELNNLRDKMHKQFINRCPADDNTVMFYIGTGKSGLDENAKALIEKFIDKVSDQMNDALVLGDVTLEKGVKVVKGGKELAYEEVSLENVENFVKRIAG